MSSTTTRDTPVRWLLSPATGSPGHGNAITMAALRILLGLLWLYNVSWKRPLDFGQDSGSGLYGFTKDAVDHPVFPPYSWIVDTFVLPNFAAFGWMVLIAETLLAVLLLTGTFVRVAALVGVGQSLAIGLSVAQTPGEWPWSYWLMIGAHLVLVLGVSGAFLAVDGARAKSGQPAAHTTPPVRLLQLWGAVVAIAGVVALVLGVGSSPFTASGAALGGSGLSISLGRYNLVAAVLLIVIGALMVAAATLRRSVLAMAAAGVAVLAALSLYVQLPWTDPLLGGNNTSAAFLLCAALVSAMLAPLLHATPGQEAHAPS